MVLICAAAFLASTLTFFSGFGLGTLLTPVFALFFPIQTAIAATAIVHLANNLFKVGLVGREADWSVVRRFGLPAAAAAVVGAGALVLAADLPPLAVYQLGARTRVVTPLKLLVGTLIVSFALLETSARFRSVQLPSRSLPWGGALAGFFGGLSGTQGALRSAFLIKAGLSKQGFVATGVVCAVLVDVVRLIVYGASQVSAHFEAVSRQAVPMVAAATISAFAGASLGARVLRQLTLETVRATVAVMMVAIGVALAAGLL
jgi:uncharacterized membrane protein YfcA